MDGQADGPDRQLADVVRTQLQRRCGEGARHTHKRWGVGNQAQPVWHALACKMFRGWQQKDVNNTAAGQGGRERRGLAGPGRSGPSSSVAGWASAYVAHTGVGFAAGQKGGRNSDEEHVEYPHGVSEQPGLGPGGHLDAQHDAAARHGRRRATRGLARRVGWGLVGFGMRPPVEAVAILLPIRAGCIGAARLAAEKCAGGASRRRRPLR